MVTTCYGERIRENTRKVRVDYNRLFGISYLWNWGDWNESRSFVISYLWNRGVLLTAAALSVVCIAEHRTWEKTTVPRRKKRGGWVGALIRKNRSRTKLNGGIYSIIEKALKDMYGNIGTENYRATIGWYDCEGEKGGKTYWRRTVMAAAEVMSLVY